MSSGTSLSGWITAAAIATLISTLVSGGLSYYWEQRKLNRSERSAAYAAFLDAFSQRWRAFAVRDGVAKSIRRLNSAREPDAAAISDKNCALDAAEARATDLRDELYEAYTRIQILAPQGVVESALRLVRLSDDRNRAFKNPGKFKSPANDTRSDALAAFVERSRIDLGLQALDKERLSNDSALLDTPWWAGGETSNEE